MRAIRLASTAAFLAVGLLLPPPSFAAAQFQITSCPYTANIAAGVYTIEDTIGVKGGDCIDVLAPDITIRVNGQTVYAGGYAIHIHSVAKNVHIVGPGDVYGTIFDEGDFAAIEDLTIGNNGNATGVTLEGVKGSVVQNNSAQGDYVGISLDNTRDCRVEGNTAETTEGQGYSPIGIAITNSSTNAASANNLILHNNVTKNAIGIQVGYVGVDGQLSSCAIQMPSVGNVINDNTVNLNYALWSPGVGIWLTCQGAVNTRVKGNTALDNMNYDLFDGNANCKPNSWRDNKTQNVYPPCVTGQPAKEKPLYAFTAGADGQSPSLPVTLGSDGVLYGTIANGGTGCGNQGCGYAFRLARTNSTWTKTVIHQFTGTNGDSQIPSSGLIVDQAGNLYGETGGNGSTDLGTVFELSPQSDGTWKETFLYRFIGGSRGQGPRGGLTFDRDGNIYGTAGVTQQCSRWANCGLIFELMPNSSGEWIERVLYTFKGHKDGTDSFAGVALDGAGNIYGTTYGGGAHGWGSVFQLTHGAGGWKERLLHSFTDHNDGGLPFGGVILDKAGNLFGTTSRGGKGQGGTVFEMRPVSGGGWTFRVIDGFADVPVAGLTIDSDGNLYGAASGDPYNWPFTGTAFKLTPHADGRWKKTQIYHFGGGPDGGAPDSSLALDGARNLYGTAESGGVDGCNIGCGVVFEVMNKK